MDEADDVFVIQSDDDQETESKIENVDNRHDGLNSSKRHRRRHRKHHKHSSRHKEQESENIDNTELEQPVKQIVIQPEPSFSTDGPNQDDIPFNNAFEISESSHTSDIEVGTLINGQIASINRVNRRTQDLNNSMNKPKAPANFEVINFKDEKSSSKNIKNSNGDDERLSISKSNLSHKNDSPKQSFSNNIQNIKTFDNVESKHISISDDNFSLDPNDFETSEEIKISDKELNNQEIKSSKVPNETNENIHSDKNSNSSNSPFQSDHSSKKYDFKLESPPPSDNKPFDNKPFDNKVPDNISNSKQINSSPSDREKEKAYEPKSPSISIINNYNAPPVEIEYKPKDIKLTTNRKETRTSFEYKILDSLDRALNHLGQEFIDDFQYYAKQAFSYDSIYDDFIMGLNSDILDIVHEFDSVLSENSEILNTKLSIEEDFQSLFGTFSNTNTVDVNAVANNKSLNIPKEISLSNEKIMKNHQILNEIRSERSHIINSEQDNENNIDYAQKLKQLEFENVELNLISDIQTERMNRIDELLGHIKDKKNALIAQNYKNKLESDDSYSYQNLLDGLILDLQDIDAYENDAILRKALQQVKSIKNDLDDSISNMSYLAEKTENLDKLMKMNQPQLFNEIERYQRLFHESHLPPK